MMFTAKRRTTGGGFVLSLALVTVLGPAGTDMYLASIPEIARAFSATGVEVQLSLTVYLLAMGAGQLIFGPLSDAFGRRTPLLAGIGMFLLASIASSLSADNVQFLASRLVQGLGAALILVVALSIVRDVADGDRAAQLFALLMTIEGLAPVLAPTIGGFIDVAFGWRAVLLLLCGLSLIALLNSIALLPETLPASRRTPFRPTSVAGAYRRITSERHFLLPALALSAVFFTLFGYIAGVSFVYQDTYGLGSSSFGTVFGASGIAVIIGAALSARLVARLGVGKLALFGGVTIATGCAVALAASASGAGLPGTVAGLSVSLLGVGMAEATLMALAMASQHTSIATAAALLGAFQLIISSTATPVAGALVEGGAVPWLVFLLVSSLVSLVLIIFATRSPAAKATFMASH